MCAPPAATPSFLDKASVDEAVLQRERDILLEQAKGSGKPEHVIEKMVAGRLNTEAVEPGTRRAASSVQGPCLEEV